MTLLKHALRANLAPEPRAVLQQARHLVIAGGAGPLGAAILERALGRGQWSSVSALVTLPIEIAIRGLAAVEVRPDLSRSVMFGDRPDTAIIVFDRERSQHGREAAFFRPEPADLPLLAAWLQAAGAKRLLVVLPHAPALLPAALKAGLASLDEHAVTALGFEQLAFVRPARAGGGAGRPGDTSSLQRLGHALLAQLHWMVPQREQPLRAAKVAEFVIELAHHLPGAPEGTRVVPPEIMWDWAQPDGGDPVLQAWLRHEELAVATRARRSW